MINAQEKQELTRLLNQFGLDRVMKALERGPKRRDWHDCFLACVYGEKGELNKIGMKPVPLLDADTKMANALGITLGDLAYIAGAFDTDTEEFLSLVEEWLELNIVKVERPLAVGV